MVGTKYYPKNNNSPLDLSSNSNSLSLISYNDKNINQFAIDTD